MDSRIKPKYENGEIVEYCINDTFLCFDTLEEAEECLRNSDNFERAFRESEEKERKKNRLNRTLQ